MDKVQAQKNAPEELEKVLLEEIQLYEKFTEHLESDESFMSKLQIDDIEASNKAKATLLLKIQALDEARQNLVKQIAQEKGLAEENIKLADICEKLAKPQSDRLMKLRERLQSVIRNLQELQNNTYSLVRSSLSWIEGSMETLKRLLTPVATYNYRGKVEDPQAFSGKVVENKI